MVVGNWKMNLDVVEAVHLTQQLGVLLEAHPCEHVDVAVTPPFVNIRSVVSVVESERIRMNVGAQHVSHFDNGAYTGEISVSMLKRVGASFVLVGHSERRQLFGMTDDIVRATLRSALSGGLRVILCVGEDAAVREAGEHELFVRHQIDEALRGVDKKFIEQIVLAYEPIWAIGSGTTADIADIEAMTLVIRKALSERGHSQAHVLYGGSVKADNCASILRDAGADGFLVGGASLQSEPFLHIVATANDCYAESR
jgi:triosephosphate isomerase